MPPVWASEVHAGACPLTLHLFEIEVYDANGRSEPDCDHEPLDTPDEVMGAHRPSDLSGPECEVALCARREPRGDNVIHIEHEAALHEAPRLSSSAASTSQPTHTFVEILSIARPEYADADCAATTYPGSQEPPLTR